MILILYLRSTDSVLTSIENYFLGLDVINGIFDRQAGYYIDSNITSAMSRINSNILLIKEFFNAPLLGIGYHNTMQVKSFGYISHTYYLFPLSSYLQI